jgi:multidrug efflux pump subunit AcrB
VHDSIELFSHSLIEAPVLVVIVALIGFWNCRTALLMAASIPITLAITFGVINTLGIDLQQVSIASLIIALGLLVDVRVVSGDAVERELAAGRPRPIAAWLGPTHLFKTMAFATRTNIVSYLPFMLLRNDPRLLSHGERPDPASQGQALRPVRKRRAEHSFSIHQTRRTENCTIIRTCRHSR